MIFYMYSKFFINKKKNRVVNILKINNFIFKNIFLDHHKQDEYFEAIHFLFLHEIQ